MKNKLTFFLGLLAAVVGSSAPAQNTVVTYQGRVQGAASDFTGSGQFKFALVTANLSAPAFATASFAFLGGVTGVNVIYGGNGYVTPPAVTITGGGGSGATATAFVSGGVVTSIQVNNSGTGYLAPPTVTIAPPPSVAYLTHWSNDGTSVNGSEPTAAVTLAVNNALFTARLGDATLANMTAFDAGLFTQPNLLLRIWFSDGTNGMALLVPPQPLTAAPYAAVAGSASSLLGGTYSNAVTFNNPANSFGGSGAGLTALNASQLTSGTVPNARLSASVSLLGQTIESSEITDGTIQPADLNTASFNTTFWRTAGNAGTAPGTHFMGTTDNQALELKVNGTRALRLEPTANSDTVNVISGSPYNAVGADVRGATIGGGGGFLLGVTGTNRVDADFGTISGGTRNAIQSGANYTTLSGGGGNTIQSDAVYATLSGGRENTIQIGADYATLSGGRGNTIQTNADYATLSGGGGNTIQSGAFYATLSGGNQNTIQIGADYATLGGGLFNRIEIGAGFATLSGGNQNTIQIGAGSATLSGGNQNTIESDALYATLSGGLANKIQTNANYATIPGGLGNSATNFAFAAGRRAKANHTGAFVWADSTDANFASTTTNQFNVRANGGARFVTSGAGLTVDGNVGIGETAPEGQLHITGPQTTPQIKIETTANNAFVKLRLESFGKPYWDFAVGGSANVMNWYYFGANQNLMSLATNGTLTTVGPVNPPSDRNVKQDFAAVDAMAVLEKVAALPIQSWAYKNSPDTRHIGPVAQDFHAAFQFNGEDDKHITTVDADGVALAAIQGLNQKLTDELKRRDAENAELKARLEKLEGLLVQCATR